LEQRLFEYSLFSVHLLLLRSVLHTICPTRNLSQLGKNLARPSTKRAGNCHGD